MTNLVKRKKYLVRVQNQTTAVMVVFANSKDEAFEIADDDMRESFDKKLAEYHRNPNPMIRNMTGAAWALKSGCVVEN